VVSEASEDHRIGPAWARDGVGSDAGLLLNRLVALQVPDLVDLPSQLGLRGIEVLDLGAFVLSIRDSDHFEAHTVRGEVFGDGFLLKNGGGE